jgi:hypothetical protein
MIVASGKKTVIFKLKLSERLKLALAQTQAKKAEVVRRWQAHLLAMQRTRALQKGLP